MDERPTYEWFMFRIGELSDLIKAKDVQLNNLEDANLLLSQDVRDYRSQLKVAIDCINAAPHSEHCAVVDWDEETGSRFEDEEEDCTCWKAEALKQMGVGDV